MNNKIVFWSVLLAGLLGVNVLAQWVFFRIDLTQDRRYSLSSATKNLLGGLTEEVYVKVYLAGDLNPGFRKLRQSVEQTLAECKAEAPRGKFNYVFIDPAEEPDTEKRNKLYESLAEKGLVPTNVVEGGQDNRRQQLLWPGALLNAGEREVPVQLLRGNITKTALENLNTSAETTEFALASALREVSQKQKKRIGLLTTLSKKTPPVRLSDLIVSLQKYYELFQVNLQTSPNLDSLDAVLVIKPDQALSEDDQLKLDQYVMSGGKAIFFLDAVETDSVGREGIFAKPIETGFNDLLYRYGVRLNAHIIKDLLSASIPLNVGNLGDKPNLQLMPWRFYPLLNDFGDVPFTRNLDAVYGRFVGSIDTVGVSEIRKTPLLFTSQYTQTLGVPAVIPYNEARQPADPKQYNGGKKAVAYLLEGVFTSLFKNKILPTDPRGAGLKTESSPTQIVVVADGDIPLNDFDTRRQTPYPLGFDRFSNDRHVFANKEFVMNTIDYLLDDNGVISAKNKAIVFRPLDQIATQRYALNWQLLNLLLPVGLVLLLGLGWRWRRGQRYAR